MRIERRYVESTGITERNSFKTQVLHIVQHSYSSLDLLQYCTRYEVLGLLYNHTLYSTRSVPGICVFAIFQAIIGGRWDYGLDHGDENSSSHNSGRNKNTAMAMEALCVCLTAYFYWRCCDVSRPSTTTTSHQRCENERVLRVCSAPYFTTTAAAAASRCRKIRL